MGSKNPGERNPPGKPKLTRCLDETIAYLKRKAIFHKVFMKLIASWTIDCMKILSVSNLSENRWSKSSRNRTQKNNVKAYFLKHRPNVELPCTVRLTRIAPRMLDAHDNLPMSMKWIVDSMADCIIPGKKAGRADDCKQITWIYNQERGRPKEYALRVEIMKDD